MQASPASADDVVRPAEVLGPALKAGAFAGVAGATVGAVSGVVRGSAPILFAGAAGIQWFALGSTFWATRTTLLEQDGIRNWFQELRGAPVHQRLPGPHSSWERTKASTLAGGISGGLVAAVTRGRANVIPGVIMFSIFGFSGQTLHNYLDRRHTEPVRQPENQRPANALQWLSSLKFSPMKSLTDDEYRKILDDKRLAIEAELALIDEAIEKIKQDSQKRE